MNQSRVLIVDDHPIVRYGLKLMIADNQNFVICGEAHNVLSTLDQISSSNPDIVILDLILGGHDGIDLIRNILRIGPQLRILVYSCQHEDIAGQRALRAGARGYVSKIGGLPQIEKALVAVARGDLFFDGASQQGENLGPAFNEGRALSTLSSREMQVLQLTGQGMPLHRIAQELDLSAKTIGTYRERLKIKLGVDKVQELVWLSQDLRARQVIEPWQKA